jgi:hypothetical protein
MPPVGPGGLDSGAMGSAICDLRNRVCSFQYLFFDPRAAWPPGGCSFLRSLARVCATLRILLLAKWVTKPRPSLTWREIKDISHFYTLSSNRLFLLFVHCSLWANCTYLVYMTDTPSCAVHTFRLVSCHRPFSFTTLSPKVFFSGKPFSRLLPISNK